MRKVLQKGRSLVTVPCRCIYWHILLFHAIIHVHGDLISRLVQAASSFCGTIEQCWVHEPSLVV